MYDTRHIGLYDSKISSPEKNCRCDISSIGLFRETATHSLKSLDHFLPDGSGVIIYFTAKDEAQIGIAVDFEPSDLQELDRYPSSVGQLSTVEKNRLKTSLHKIGYEGRVMQEIDKSLAWDRKREDHAAERGRSYTNSGSSGIGALGCVGGPAAGVLVWMMMTAVFSLFMPDGVASTAGFIFGALAAIIVLVFSARSASDREAGVGRYFDRVSELGDSIVNVSDDVSELGRHIDDIDKSRAELEALGLDVTSIETEVPRHLMGFLRACNREFAALNKIYHYEGILRDIPASEIERDDDLRLAGVRLSEATSRLESASADRDTCFLGIKEFAGNLEKDVVVAKAKIKAARDRHEGESV